MRTVYNQYDSMVRPLQKWLDERGVIFELNTRVTDLGSRATTAKKTVTHRLRARRQPARSRSAPSDLCSGHAGFDDRGVQPGRDGHGPVLNGKADGGAWALWERSPRAGPNSAVPAAFADHIDESKWVSFTTRCTIRPSSDRRDLTGNVPGEGGLITFRSRAGWPRSSSRTSRISSASPTTSACSGATACRRQARRLRQEADVGLHRPRDHDRNSGPSAASRRRRRGSWDIHLHSLHDAVHHQPVPAARRATGRRSSGKGSKNLAFIGQFCELPDDVVFTVEYSIRSAQTAVYALLGLKREPPAVYQGKFARAHGTSEFYRARAAITRRLIEQYGFTIVAVEADWPDAAAIDRYVRHSPHQPMGSTPFTRFPTWMWRNTDVDAFIGFLRDHNTTRSPAEKVGFYGLDLYNMTASIAAVLAYLDRVDPKAADAAREHYACLSPWSREPAAYGQASLTEGYALCEIPGNTHSRRSAQERTAICTKGQCAEFFDAAQNARLVADAESYYRAMYFGSQRILEPA
jgi:hypothetical protein